jgi:undecaprenyl-diphosphatase
MTNTARNLIQRADGRDRALLLRLARGSRTRRSVRRFWLAVTHIGGAPVAIAFAAAPFFVPSLESVGANAMLFLVLSHAVVQMVKRTVSRPRPSVHADGITLAVEPDRFSFPSGHSAAAMSVAIAYALAFPPLAAPLMIVAMLVGASRVMLGVHYPGDVVMGQVLAVATGWLVISLG